MRVPADQIRRQLVSVFRAWGMPLDIDGWGLDVVIGGSQKAFMTPSKLWALIRKARES